MLTAAGGAALVFAVGVQAYRANVREAQAEAQRAALRQAQVAVALNTALHAADLVVQLKGGSNRAIRSADVLLQNEEPGAPVSWTVIAGSADGLLFRERFTLGPGGRLAPAGLAQEVSQQVVLALMRGDGAGDADAAEAEPLIQAAVAGKTVEVQDEALFGRPERIR